ncbi:hypothetical protein LSH36_44g03056, partial [Paralvinella palmiformis]
LNPKVTVCGASGGIGQPLSLLLKLNARISHLALYDIVDSPGFAADLGHISTTAKVTGHLGKDQLMEALEGSDVVVILAGVPSKPGINLDDLFKTNAPIVRDLADAIAQFSSKAIVCIVTQPINSTVPVASEVFKMRGTYDPNKIFGVSTLNIIRANTFIAKARELNVCQVNCPVVGGHSCATLIPLISQCRPLVSFPQNERNELTKRVQSAGTDIVRAKVGAGSATLSTAYAAARFIDSVLRALAGEAGIVECAYVRSDETDAKYFATPLLLGKCGLEKNLGLGKILDFELDLIKAVMPELKKNIQKGEGFLLGD